MIVPSSRLLWAVGIIVIPLTLIGALAPSLSFILTMVVLLFGALALIDAVISLGALEGIKVELPKVVRFSKDRTGNLPLLIHNETLAPRFLRMAFAFPPEIRTESEDLPAMLPADSALSRISLACTPKQRGNYRLDRCYLETVSRFGFWAMRRICPVSSEVRVYPNLFEERKSVAAIFLNRGLFGVHARRQVGRGRDFEKLREYIPGDSFDEIHWKATARRGKPITKVFQIERTQEVYVIIDASRLSARKQTAKKSPPSETTKTDPAAANEMEDGASPALERFVNAALVLGLAAEQQGDLFGLLTFSDKVLKFVRAKNGQAHYNTCRDALYTLQPQMVTPDFNDIFSFIRVRLRKRAMLFFLTALDDPVLAENFTHGVELVCRQHLVLVNMFQPAGVSPVFNNPNVTTMDELYRELGGHTRWHNLRELEKELGRQGVRFSMLENEKLSAQLVMRYLEVKQRQLL